jgi:hypothetical protein
MVNITLTVPEDLRKDMHEFPEMNWSVIARTAIKKRIEMLKKFKEFNKESDMNEEDAIDFGRKVNKKAFKNYKK